MFIIKIVQLINLFENYVYVYVCVCVCVWARTCVLFFNYDLDALKSCVCFRVSVHVKTNFEGWKYRKSLEVLYVQSFDTYPLCCPHFTT